MLKNIKTAEQLATEKTKQLAERVRSQRNALIAKTDHLVMPDYPISADQLAEVNEYRRLLRDVTEQAGYPESIDWPDEHKIIKRVNKTA